MKTNDTVSRRRLLASVPAIATALPGLAIAEDDNEADAELLALKPQFDEVFEEWWQKHEAWELHSSDFEAELFRRTGVTRAQSWELQGAEKKIYVATLEALVTENSIVRRSTQPCGDDGEDERKAERRFALIDEILSHYAVTREGLALQCRAMIMEGYDDWDDRVMWFVASVAAFVSVEQ